MNKQLIFMGLATLAGTVGVFVISPFWGVAVYYLFSVLRPQFMWEWSLPRDVNWSYYVALATIIASVFELFGARLGGSAREGSESPRHLRAAHKWVLVFGGWIAVTYATALNQDVAYLTFVEYLKIFVMFAASSILIRTVHQVWWLFVLAGCALAYIAYEINFFYLVNGQLRIFHHGYGGLDNNGAALMLAMGVPICFFIWHGIRQWWRWAFLGCIPVLLHAVLMSYSRGAMLSLVVVAPLILFRSKEWAKGALFAAALGLMIPILAGPEIQNRFFSIQEHEVDASAQSRRDSWMAAMRMANDHPVFGVGIRNANLLSQSYGADVEGRTIHSQYLQIAADNGFVGLALYLVMQFAAWQSLSGCRRHAAAQPEAEGRLTLAIANGVECALCVYWFGSLFLSLEVVELPYMLLLLAAQLPVVSGVGQVATTFVATGQAPTEILEEDPSVIAESVSWTT
jgi:probable O-glycosylation ligase (exosortase A-associated)